MLWKRSIGKLKIDFTDAVSALCCAWNELIDIPCPFFKPEDGRNNELIPAAFPVIGWVTGMIVALAGALISAVFNIYAGGVAFAVLGWCVLTFKDSCRGDTILCRNIKIIPFDKSLIFVPWLLRFVLLLIIGVMGCKWYFALVIAGGFAMQALVATGIECRVSLLPDTPEARRMLIIVSAVIAVITFPFCRLETALAVVVFAGLYMFFAKRIGEFAGEEAVEKISNYGCITEWALLFAGILF
jgi:hypothetical protein